MILGMLIDLLKDPFLYLENGDHYTHLYMVVVWIKRKYPRNIGLGDKICHKNSETSHAIENGL